MQSLHSGLCARMWSERSKAVSLRKGGRLAGSTSSSASQPQSAYQPVREAAIGGSWPVGEGH